MNINDIITESQHKCPHCGRPVFEYSELGEGKKDACYYKVKASAKVWPSAYASGRLVQCRKKGAANYGNKSEGVAEAAKWRDPKYKDRLYTQEPGDSDDYDNIGYGYDFPERPENDPGQKRRMGGVGGEFDRNDPLVKGQGIGRSGIKHSLNLAGKRKGLPSRDQITSLKGSIKDAHGKHRKPNLPEQGVAEGIRDLGYDAQSLIFKLRRDVEEKRLQPTRQAVLMAARELAGDMDFAPELLVRQVLGQGMAEAQLDEKCWDGYQQQGMKNKGGRQVPNCRPKESLNEFAPGSGGDDDTGDDPYKYPNPESYRRSADYFGQFEADHFDREDFDDATGVFKGYWGSKQIAYFKFDNSARTGSDDPGMGWYYEPQSGGSDDTSAKPTADRSDERKQQELGMIRQFLKSSNRPSPGSQIYNLMKRHGIEEDLSRRGFLRGLGAVAAGAVGVGAAGSAQARSTDASRKEDEVALALLAKGMTPEQVAKKLGVAGPNHGQTHQMGGGWATINRAAAQLRRQRGLNEFAMGGGDDDGNDGFSDDTLKQLAAQWYNGDEDPRVEQTLAAAGWEIGQDEGYDDTPGVFVVQAGDINGRSYISWPAHELEGLDEAVDPEIEEMYEAMEQLAEEMAAKKGVSVDLVWESFEALDDHMLYETAAWRRKEGKSKKGGLNAKGVASYRRENPGSKLQMAVTTKPSKLKKGSKAAKRRKSFCARMGGVKGPMKKPNGKPTRKALALRKWNC